MARARRGAARTWDEVSVGGSGGGARAEGHKEPSGASTPPPWRVMCASHHSISLTTPRTDETLQPADPSQPLLQHLAVSRSLSQPLSNPLATSRARRLDLRTSRHKLWRAKHITSHHTTSPTALRTTPRTDEARTRHREQSSYTTVVLVAVGNRASSCDRDTTESNFKHFKRGEMLNLQTPRGSYTQHHIIAHHITSPTPARTDEALHALSQHLTASRSLSPSLAPSSPPSSPPSRSLS